MPAPVNDAWTGGQFSLFRLSFGVFLAVGFLREAIVVESSGLPSWVALVIAALFTLGFVPRFCALWLALFSVSLLRWYSLSAADLLVTCLILAMVAMPPAPFGSVQARGRLDPRGTWHHSPTLRACLWLLLLGTCVWHANSNWNAFSPRCIPRPLSGREILHHGALLLELVAIPLFFWQRRRWLAWICPMLAHLALGIITGNLELLLGLFWVQFFLFNPAWLPSRSQQSGHTLYFDGDCALCHGIVRFVLAEDHLASFRFTPLQSPALTRARPELAEQPNPNTVLVHTADGRWLSHSTAVVFILQELGGLWRVLGTLLYFIPRPLRDAAYRIVARLRSRLFAKPSQICPLLPAELAQRFQD